jgi:tetratricopeptide (TPR) repeat protein
MTAAAMSQGAALRWTGMLVVALVLLAGVQRWITPDGASEPARAAVPAYGPANYDEALDQLNREVARGEARLVANADSWAAHEALANALHARRQLTGSHEDLAAALERVGIARGFAPDRGGPVLGRAVIALSLHLNDIAAEEVARIPVYAVPADVGERAEGEAILGDVALYRGDYRAALVRYRAAEDLQPGLGSTVRLSDWHRHMGRIAEARAILDTALAQQPMPPWAKAAVLLQRGAIDLQTGDWEAAEEYFAQADKVFPGWWLVRAHRGQMAATRGRFAEAERLYREALAGAERPSVMDALAAILEAQGRDGEAERIAQQAAALWKARVASHPAAYADHAFEAYLAEGDTANAFRLAALNYRTRPYGDGRIGLARAAAARGKNAQARAVLEELDRTGWRSTEQYRVLAEVCERLGDDECAVRARQAALKISPKAFDPRADLLFFSNH